LYRDHLCCDLQPYVCTYLECDEPNESYYDYDSWNMHEQRMHRRVWVCKLADKETFTEQAEYERHVRSFHPESASKLLMPELISARESTLKRSDRECPICLRGFVYTHQMQHHIARHLESIALLALPPEDDIESESNETLSAKSHVAEWRNRVAARSTAEDFPEERGKPPKFSENDSNDGNASDSIGAYSQGLTLTLENLQKLEPSVEVRTGSEVVNHAESGNARFILAWRSKLPIEFEATQNFVTDFLEGYVYPQCEHGMQGSRFRHSEDAVAWIIRRNLELDTPRGLQIAFSRIVQREVDALGRELLPEEVVKLFEQEYHLKRNPRFELIDYDITTDRSAPAAPGTRHMKRMFKGVITIDGIEHQIRGIGNGAISSLANALKGLGIDLDVCDYKEHAIGEGVHIKAATYIECTVASSTQKVWGVGIHEDVVQASLMALLSAASSVSIYCKSF